MVTPKFFALAGHSTFTVKSLVTGKHLTFKVEQPKESMPHFVSVMTGTDNEGDFTFLGSIFNGSDFKHGRKSRISPEAPSAKAFAWLWKKIDAIPENEAEFIPSGRCCRCNRTLTTPESVERGVGPECLKKCGM